ncbi:translation initiation factor IF-2-like isoform X2 [Oxyura jamaicensis]|uniref:translation initiation factor IF-2-like isoform X2 n=1 Tax=Oxyura jamaicensis TaxID=8884 RepID=UPI0015A54F9C|nr:translation initiation factor IF-2-like isoform X2 [Oxyura jamaicensis]
MNICLCASKTTLRTSRAARKCPQTHPKGPGRGVPIPPVRPRPLLAPAPLLGAFAPRRGRRARGRRRPQLPPLHAVKLRFTSGRRRPEPGSLYGASLGAAGSLAGIHRPRHVPGRRRRGARCSGSTGGDRVAQPLATALGDGTVGSSRSLKHPMPRHGAASSSHGASPVLPCPPADASVEPPLKQGNLGGPTAPTAPTPHHRSGRAALGFLGARSAEPEGKARPLKDAASSTNSPRARPRERAGDAAPRGAHPDAVPRPKEAQPRPGEGTGRSWTQPHAMGRTARDTWPGTRSPSLLWEGDGTGTPRVWFSA